ncbi:ATP-binding protein [Kitasatospora sp. NPDC101183]|uniref:ATP-binding protein n=1 Tax=Kitasatospora sp. NPDC101183 TaxID=3364100 RepID=UPI003820C74D
MPELGLDAEELDDIAGDVLVVLSELATNAVVHGCGGNGRAGVALSAALRLTGDGSSLRVCVSDPGAGLPVVRAADGEAVGGRGLALVLALADRFGVDPLAGGGKSVWAEFDLPVPALAVARAPGGPAGGAGAAAGAGGAGTNTGGGLTRTPQRPPGEGGLRPGHGSRRSDTAPRPPHHRTGTRSGELRWPVGELGRLEGARPPLGPGPELGRGCAPWATRTRAGDSIQLIASGTGSRPSFPLHEATPLATQAVTAPRSAAIA